MLLPIQNSANVTLNLNFEGFKGKFTLLLFSDLLSAGSSGSRRAPALSSRQCLWNGMQQDPHSAFDTL